MQHDFPHELDLPTAKRAVELAFEHYSERLEKYHPSMEWTGEHEASVRFSVGAVSLSGEISIRRDLLQVFLDVPVIFKVFKKRGVAVVEQEIERWSVAAINSHSNT